jgi:hypothetical protein
MQNKVPLGEATAEKLSTFCIYLENQAQGCARQRRFVEKMVTAEVFLLERQPRKTYYFGGGGVVPRGVQKSYTPVCTKESKYKICSSWRDNPEEINTFLLFQNIDTGVPKNLHD